MLAGSGTGLRLVRSICRQIHFCLGHPLGESDHLLTAEYENVVSHFHELLATHPLVLLIDSLDQLANDNLARSDISFLKKVPRVHKDTRIIVSALPDERDAGTYLFAPSCHTSRKCFGVSAQKLLFCPVGLQLALA